MRFSILCFDCDHEWEADKAVRLCPACASVDVHVYEHEPELGDHVREYELEHPPGWLLRVTARLLLAQALAVMLLAAVFVRAAKWCDWHGSDARVKAFTRRTARAAGMDPTTAQGRLAYAEDTFGPAAVRGQCPTCARPIERQGGE